MADATSGVRNRYVDLVRVVAIVLVVVGHWLDTAVVVTGGLPRGMSALVVVVWARWLTLPFQVMPLFFLAGGYAAAAAWDRHAAAGRPWPGWLHARLVRLLWPTSRYVATMSVLAAVALLAGTDRSVVAQGGWAVALQLWFLPVYLLLMLLAVPLLALWRRTGWWLLAAGVLAVAVVDVLAQGLHVHAAGWANYLLGWAVPFCLGFAWRDGALARPPVAAALLGGGMLAFLALVVLADYPPWMVGVPGERVANTAPPDLALVTFAIAQTGLVLLLEPAGRRWLRAAPAALAVARANAVVMLMYLWHMVPVLLLVALAHAAGWLPGPPIGSGSWWLWRIPWELSLAVLLTGLVMLLARVEARAPTPAGWLAGGRAATLLTGCVVATGYALYRLAVFGFAPGGRLPLGTLAVYAAGMVALALAGRQHDGAATPADLAAQGRRRTRPG